jgi:hypothetical protein
MITKISLDINMDKPKYNDRPLPEADMEISAARIFALASSHGRSCSSLAV